MIRYFGLFLVISPLWAAQVVQPPVMIQPGWGTSSEGKEILRYSLVYSSSQVTFLPVRNWIIGTNSFEPRVTFSAPDFRGALSFELVSTNMSLTNSLDGTVIRSFPCYAGDIEGEAVDYQKAITPHTKLAGRRAIFKNGDVAILVQMTCRPDTFEAMSRVFHSFTATVQFSPAARP